MICFPNAKINIGLNITAKRSDGFHEIESVFYPIHDLYDVLEIIENTETNSVEFNATGIPIPGSESDNLCLKAYQLINEIKPLPPIKIHLHKNIPIGAGMGGGSSDAAFFIKLLNDKFQLHLSYEQMYSIALKLGSDCAFFLNNTPAFVTGRGEHLAPISFSLENKVMVIIYPNIHISTKEAYAGVIPAKSKTNLLDDIKMPMLHWRENIKNDFEASIFKKYPELNELIQQLYVYGAEYAAMSGSGSTIFGIFDSNQNTNNLSFSYEHNVYKLK